jgi:hypothetical protein
MKGSLNVKKNKLKWFAATVMLAGVCFGLGAVAQASSTELCRSGWSSSWTTPIDIYCSGSSSSSQGDTGSFGLPTLLVHCPSGGCSSPVTGNKWARAQGYTNGGTLKCTVESFDGSTQEIGCIDAQKHRASVRLGL